METTLSPENWTGATLAVGTEVTDGQILDRNSAWISGRLADAGVQVIEHRAVPDERALILAAIEDLGARADLLFITGGLGPTSDDFTRDLIAQAFGRPLEFDPGSWDQVNEKLTARGVSVREMQRQQCYFPKGAEILLNPAGTANGFCFREGRKWVFALPGPPHEIAAIWEKGVAPKIEALVPEGDREILRIWRCLGKGESDIAHITETVLAGQGLRIGYRASLPYVEVKVWLRSAQAARSGPVLDRLEEELRPWLVNRDHEDLAEDLLEIARQQQVEIHDAATGGRLIERVSGRMRESREPVPAKLSVHTHWALAQPPAQWMKNIFAADSEHVQMAVVAEDDRNVWRVGVHFHGAAIWETLTPPYVFKPSSERGRAYITEKAMQILVGHLTALSRSH